MAEENNLEVEINQAYIDLVGEEFATAENVAEAYAGQFPNDEEFAMDMAEQTGAIPKNAEWPLNAIDWFKASRDLMIDYSEQDGYYFRNL